MSNTPEPEMDLDLHFLPAWARQSSDVNRYAYYEGGRESGPRGPRDRRRDAPPPGGGRGRPDRPPRREGRPGEQRPGGPRGREGRPEGPRDGGRGRRPEPRESAPPLPEVLVSFVPEAKGVESLARQIRLTGRAYPVFEIAHLVLSKPDRYQVTFGVEPRPEGGVAQELWVCDIDNTLWLSQDEAVSHVFRKHFEMFYQAEKTPTDPPKGTYTFVAQCGMSGVILGPPNYHDYQSKLRKLHAARFAHMPLEAYKSRVRIVRDEATVQKWVEEQSFRTEYNCLNVPEALKLPNREQAEKHFREVHLPTLIRRVETWTASGSVAQQLPSAPLRQVLRRAWEDQHRFPLRVVTVLSQQFAGHGLQFFKVNKTVTHVCVARPHHLDLEQSPVSDGIRRIVDHIQAHEGCSRRELVEVLAPSQPAAAPARVAPAATEPAQAEPPAAPSSESAAPAPATPPAPAAPATPQPSPEQTAIIADLHWLIHQGHVIEFANGRLELAKKPKPKPEPKPPKPAAPAPAPAADTAPSPAEPVPAAAGEEPVAPPPAEETTPAAPATSPPPAEAAEPLDAASEVPPSVSPAAEPASGDPTEEADTEEARRPDAPPAPAAE